MPLVVTEIEWLKKIRVVDLTSALGTLAVRVLSEYGAEVTRVEPPGGDPLRECPPVTSAPGGTRQSLYWLHMMHGRKTREIDLASSGGRAAFEELLAGADLVVESRPPGALAQLGVDIDAALRANPRLVWASITPFGLTGPRADWAATDLIGMASGGLLSLCGDRDMPPLRVSVEQGYAQAGIQALPGILFALRHARLTGEGQRIDVSMQAAVANTLGNARLYYEIEGMETIRAGGGRAFGSAGSRLVYPCADGHVAFSRTPTGLQPLFEWMVEQGIDPGFDPAEIAALPQAGRGMPPTEVTAKLESSILQLFAALPKMTIYEEGQRRGIMTCPVSTPADLLENRQLDDRGFWTERLVPELEAAVTVPGPPVRIDWLPAVEAPAPAAPSDPRLSLAGLRVADFSWVGVAPCATQQLALFGAEVIRVESTRKLDVFRGSGPKRGDDPDASAYWATCNRDKQAITLDLRHPRGREVALRLIAESDVVVESFTPGFLESVGLSMEEIHDANPRVITMSCSMEGSTGPHARYRGFGLVLQATVGFTHFTAWPGRIPVGTGVAYTDWFATHLAAFAVLAAIEQRDRCGSAAHIDLSQLEACIWGLDAEVLRLTAGGEMRPAIGNDHESMSPHGVFRAAGDDAWIAIAVRDTGDWRALASLLGAPWMGDERLDSFDARKADSDRIAAAITAWTSTREKSEAAEVLQRAGIPAYGVSSMSDVHNDPQLRAREHFWPLEHAAIGLTDWDSPAYRLSKVPVRHRRAAPLLGQDNERVYRDLLGYSDEELVTLIAEGVLD